MTRADFPKPLRQSLFTQDILLGALPLDALSNNAATLYLASLGLTLPSLLVPGRLFFKPHQAYWAGGGGSWPAIVALAKDRFGEHRAVECTFLAEDGSGLAPVRSPKLYFGTVNGLYMPLSYGGAQGGPRGTGTHRHVTLVHSLETGLAVLLAHPNREVWATFSLPNLQRLPLDLLGVHSATIVWEERIKTRRIEILEALRPRCGNLLERVSSEFFASSSFDGGPDAA